ncbi:MAG: molybdopterin oxidoreductase family protein [Caldilineaceae bacterium]|nr:molybdopterin oxidoreductase family protein [Caldilineaceae bacterium]
MSRIHLYQNNPAIDVVTGACPHDCPDTCSWQVAVDQQTGQAIDIWGNASHPITQGRLCGKVDRYLERTYHTGRLTTPLRRVGPKGSGQFEPVSWESALAAIGTRLAAIVEEWGSQAVLPYSYSGTLGYLQGEGMAARFFNRMGASKLARTICSEAGFEGYLYTLGATLGTAPEDFAHARLILIWGSNTLTSNLHLWQFVQAARKKGARVVVIDPARTRTAKAADEWIAIRPGTDAALALAMMHVIIDENLHDTDYVEKYTIGFEQLARRVKAWTPERAAAITGIPAERIRALAIDYAAASPAAIRVNYGMQRHAGGGMAMRTITCLPALVGSWRTQGGGIQLSASGGFRRLDLSGLQRPDLRRDPAARTINMNRLGDALSLDPARVALSHYRPRPVDSVPSREKIGPPVKALIVYNANPASATPDQSAVTAGLAREDLFTVVMEQFQTDTANYADYILPATTQLEQWDLHRSYGHNYLSLNRPAIARLGECLPNAEIFRRLAASLGYTDDCFQTDDETILRELVQSQTQPEFDTCDWETLLRDGYARLNLPDPYLPFAQGNFPTPSGKCEFYSQRMADDGYDPLPTYESRDWGKIVDGVGADAPEPQFPISNTQPLICISPPAHSFLNTSFGVVDRLRTREKEPTLQMHPADAAARQITDGEPVRVWNELGEVALIVRVTDDLIPGTVLAPGVWWASHSPDGRNINRVVGQYEADMGAGACFYDARVFVASAAPDHADALVPAVREVG